MLWRQRAPARARRTAPVGFVEPCAPTLIGRPPLSGRWTHEVKHDGYRIIAKKDGPDVRMWTRLQNETQGRFARIAAALTLLPVSSCTIDGEAVIFRPDGHSDFHALRSSAGAAIAQFVAFDILELAGEDLRRLPIEDRRARLARLVPPAKTGRKRAENEAIVLSQVYEQDGAEVYAAACALGLEGIVSKRAGSVYRSGRSSDWVKTKNPLYVRR